MMKETKKAFLKFNILNNLRSPAFYILSIIFTVFLSANYFIRHQFFTGNGTTDLLLYFSAIPYICILIIPSLCYKQSFSIYDDFVPLTPIEKIIISFASKFILFAAMLIFSIPQVLLVNLFGSVDWGQFFISYLCLLFYGAAVISLCIFIEKTCSNKILSFVLSAIFLAIFNSAHVFTVYVPLPEVISNVLKLCSFAWHFDAASKGILDSRDILWLSGTTAFFILSADLLEEKKKGRVFTRIKLIPKLTSIVIALLVMLNGNRWYFRGDLSANKLYSPSKYTKQLLSKADQNIKITFYRSGTMAKLYPQIRDVSDFLIQYCSLSKNASLIIKNPDKDSQSRTLLENYGIQSQQLKTVSSTSTEYVNVYSAIVIEYNGNVELLPFTMSANTLEYDLDVRVKQLLTGISKTVNIIIGNGMSLNDDYGYVVPWLNSQGFVCNSLSISDPGFSTALGNSNGPLLVIGDSQIKIEQAIAIENYILSNKGNALFMVNPYSADIENSWYLTENKSTNLVEILENWGVVFKPQIAADISCSRITMYADDNSETQNINYPLWISLLQQENSSLGMTLFWATPLELSESAEPYLLSTPLAYAYDVDRKNKETLIETNPFILQTVNTADKQKESLILAARISGPLNGLFNNASTDNSQVIVIPDSLFLNSLMNQYIGGEYGDYRNFEFTTTSLLKLNGEEELAVLQAKTTRDTSFYKVSDLSQLNLYMLIVYLVSFIILPLLITAGGIVFYVLKKR